MSESVSKPQNKPPVASYSGQRAAIALGSWCPAGIGIFTSVMFAGAGLSGNSTQPILAFALLPLFAWIALALMSVRWIQGRRCHWLWPVLGTVCGVVSAVAFSAVFFFYISAVPLAFYLAHWHLIRRAEITDGV